MWADFIEALTNTVINDSIYFYLLLLKLCGAVCPERNRTEKETNNEAYNNSGFCLCLFFFLRITCLWFDGNSHTVLCIVSWACPAVFNKADFLSQFKLSLFLETRQFIFYK